jgi:hypothetical protein
MLLETSKFFKPIWVCADIESIDWTITILTVGRYDAVLVAVSYFHLLSARNITVAYKLCIFRHCTFIMVSGLFAVRVEYELESLIFALPGLIYYWRNKRTRNSTFPPTNKNIFSSRILALNLRRKKFGWLLIS